MPLPNPGIVLSVNLSQRRTVRKTRGKGGTLVFDRGFEGDAHAGDWHRQVSLLGQESIDEMVSAGLKVGPGDFAENITTSGIDLLAIPVGSLIRIGESAVLEISQIGKVCHTRCAIYYQAGDCVMPRDGLFAVVRAAGDVRVGDTHLGGVARRRNVRPDAGLGDRGVRGGEGGRGGGARERKPARGARARPDGRDVERRDPAGAVETDQISRRPRSSPRST